MGGPSTIGDIVAGVWLETGLTPRSNTFTVVYRTGSGAAVFIDRRIRVIPLSWREAAMRKILTLSAAVLLALCAGPSAATGHRATAVPDWNTADSGLVLAGLWESTDVVTGSGLPITLTGCSYRTILRTQVPVQSGDALDVTANARVTDDASEPRYNTGITWNLAYYDVDNGLGSSGTWYGLGTSQGQNVTPDTHHLSMAIDRTLRVPSTWTPGHRIAVVLRACAESTAARPGDAITVDPLGELIVLRWTTPAATPAAAARK